MLDKDGAVHSAVNVKQVPLCICALLVRLKICNLELRSGAYMYIACPTGAPA